MTRAPVDVELANVVRRLSKIALKHDMGCASLVVRRDGRTEIEVSDMRKGFRTVARYDIDEHGLVTEQPLYAFPRDGKVSAAGADGED